jgi:hypothetical protein
MFPSLGEIAATRGASLMKLVTRSCIGSLRAKTRLVWAHHRAAAPITVRARTGERASWAHDVQPVAT